MSNNCLCMSPATRVTYVSSRARQEILYSSTNEVLWLTMCHLPDTSGNQITQLTANNDLYYGMMYASVKNGHPSACPRRITFHAGGLNSKVTCPPDGQFFQSFIKTPAFIFMCCSSCFTEAKCNSVFVSLSRQLNSRILASENDVNEQWRQIGMGIIWMTC